MNCWQIAIRRGKFFLVKHDAESAVKTFSYALRSCPSCHCKEISMLLFYLGIALKRLGFLNSALKVWIAANRLKKNKHINNIIPGKKMSLRIKLVGNQQSPFNVLTDGMRRYTRKL